jgi:hypothetical protein
VLERINWMASWLPRVPDEVRPARCGQVAEAPSRLEGHRSRVTVEENDGKLRPTLTRSSDAHKQTVEDNGLIRTIDYSDPSMLKEYVLR